MMSRSEVIDTYAVSESGVIESPGKFEGDMLYVPAVWAQCMEGFYDFDENGVFGVVFDDDDRDNYPEIGTAYGILLEESEQGFVNVQEFETQATYDAQCDAVCAQECDDEG